uniref:Uncharacterized protein n=1 Tax=Anguilla anguilla TaxID=7936 RepID=A0A0E9W8J0_ANGAN
MGLYMFVLSFTGKKQNTRGLGSVYIICHIHSPLPEPQRSNLLVCPDISSSTINERVLKSRLLFIKV